MKNTPYASKIRKMSRVLRIVLQVLFWITIVGMAGLAVAAIITPFLPNDPFMLKGSGNQGFILSMDSVIRYRIPVSNAAVSVKPIYRAIAISAAFCSCGLAIVFRQLTALLKTVENDKPFAKENAKRLNVIGIVLIIGSVVIRLAGGLIANSIINTFNITNIDVNISIDPFLALCGIMMLILGGVFKYGSYLQEEYDSTL